ncbi:MAG: hypothetical protein ABIT01_01190 [Thermoanaerobaculia bacterium]
MSFDRLKVRVLGASALLLLTLASTTASAYIIYLKGGRKITAKEKPSVQGKNLVFYSPIGALQTVPVSEYDEAATVEANKSGAGDAYVLGEAPNVQEPAALKKPSLSQYIKVNKKTDIPEEPHVIPPMPKTGDSGDATTPSTRPAHGELAAPNMTALDPQVDNVFSRALETSGIRGPRVLPLPRGVRIQAVTENEDQVFGALKAIARGLKESNAGGHPLDKADIYLSTASGESAGHFEMTTDQADALLNGKITVAKYFVANVTL